MRCFIASPRYRPRTSTSCQRGDLTLEITAGGPISAFVEAAARNARVCTRLATRCHEDPMIGAEDRGYRSGRHGEPCFTLARARAEPLAISTLTRRPKAFSPFFRRRCGHERRKNPASEEAGRVDPVGSVAVAAGPDQREAVVALSLHQRGVDRGREARIVELNREILAIAVAGGLLPGSSELRVMWCTT